MKLVRRLLIWILVGSIIVVLIFVIATTEAFDVLRQLENNPLNKRLLLSSRIFLTYNDQSPKYYDSRQSRQQLFSVKGQRGDGRNKTHNDRNEVPTSRNKKNDSSTKGKQFSNLKRKSHGKNNTSTIEGQKKQMTLSSTQKPSATNLPENSRSVPPWQVLGTKQIQMKVEQEKARRSMIQKGLLAAHATDPLRKNVSIKQNDNKDDDDNYLNDEYNDGMLLSKNFLSPIVRRFLKWKRFNPTTTIVGQRFVGAFLDPNELPPSFGIPEIAFLGRSNVGKSSLLNRLTKVSSALLSSSTSTINSKTKLNTIKSRQQQQPKAIQFDSARVGKTPGATASVNMYTLMDYKGRDVLGWVDLPGFGYAKLSKETKESVQLAAENYLNRRKELALGILLIDIRRTNVNIDEINLLNVLYDMNIPIVVVATKVDKIPSKTIREQSIESIRRGLNLPVGQPLCVSSTTGKGIKELWQIILDGCEMAVSEANLKYEQKNNHDSTEEYDYDDDEDEDDGNENTTFERSKGAIQTDTKTSTRKDNTSMQSIPEENVDNYSYDDIDDNDDFEYDQGYDWVDPGGKSVMYEGNENDDYYGHVTDSDRDFNVFDENHAIDSTTFNGISSSMASSPKRLKKKIVPSQQEINQSNQQQRLTLRSLKKRVKEMEKRGEI